MVMTFHEARNEMAIAHNEQLERVRAENKHKTVYYILVSAKVRAPGSDIIDIKMIVLSKRQRRKLDPMIGTMLYHVDNLKGTMDRIWCLPRDIIQPEATINKVGDYSDEIFHMGKAPNR